MMKKLFFILYPFALLSLTIFSYFFIDSNLTYLKDFYSGFAYKHRYSATFFYLLILLIFFTLYILLLKLISKKKIDFKDLRYLIFITIALLLFSYPAMLSFDIFNYISTSKVLFFYYENPYIIMPIEFAGDPLLSFTHASNKIALYGPSWILISAIPYFTGFGNFIVTLFSFKLFVSMFYLGTVFLIWKISKNLVYVSFFAFNPLVIIETLLSGHNDIVMMFFSLFSFYLLMKKKIIIPAFIFFIFSIFIKYSVIFLFPIFIYIILKTIRKQPIDWKNIFYFSFLLMAGAFILSPIREEIYPWYAIWFLPFISIVFQKRTLVYISVALSFGLLLRYVPFMLFGTHFGVTPFLKISVTLTPVFFVLIYVFLRDKLWLKIFSR
ncbi:MAG: hypothetical protein A3D74_00760 [Candidatus Levybacteria bacterium RIFCSPHIGHO2_02_FULL_37_13]|nr:MAG: hypothetical protein A3D74_00760 [Candidatus Levybacteria bacterium RIFCSPHIGHO2_02_FULL_37_13]OGH30241.1 MAG: hypothetical protein A3E40_02025 [Candidatus Levybacteria bacterium RIFCSPHIGHO2_12_FULL_37_9]OGH39449.1 MAG: hypothetical protein A3B41_01055 [Candidatus Levybacteria bacterium RIFCSPLOWO2_01_FULL_37_26]